MPLCSYDRVLLYEGSEIKNRLCGNLTSNGPIHYVFSGNHVHIIFTSDSGIQSSGFVLYYHIIPRDAGRSTLSLCVLIKFIINNHKSYF